MKRRRTARRKWTADEDAQVRAGYDATKPISAIAAEVGRSRSSVYQRAKKLGLACLRGSDRHRVLSSIHNRGRRRSPQTEFQKGHVPWIKGLKGMRLSPATEFQAGCLRGQAARNWRPVGTIVEWRDKSQHRSHGQGRGHRGKLRRWIKVRDDGPPKKRWVRLATYLWEKANGPIPKGLRLVHLDGDTMNAELANLTLISLRELPAFQRRLNPSLEGRRRAAAKKAMKLRWATFRARRQMDTDRKQSATKDPRHVSVCG